MHHLIIITHFIPENNNRRIIYNNIERNNSNGQALYTNISEEKIMNRETLLITGATSGIGLVFAKKFFEMNYETVLVGRNFEKLQEVSKIISPEGKNIHLLQADLSEKNSAESVYNQCKEKNLDIDMLINNAGFGLHGENTELSLEELEKMMILNMVTLTKLCHLFGKDMKIKGKGHILNVASTAAYQPLPFMAVYGATKSFVLNFSEALHEEMKEYGVNVTCLCPGATNTAFFSTAGIGDGNRGFFAKKSRMSVEEVVNTGMKALFAKKMSVIPGIINNILAWSNRLVPRTISVKLARNFSQKT